PASAARSADVAGAGAHRAHRARTSPHGRPAPGRRVGDRARRRDPASTAVGRRPPVTAMDEVISPDASRGGHHDAPRWRHTLRRRVWVAAVFIALWAVAIQARLVYLQVVRHTELAAKADR